MPYGCDTASPGRHATSTEVAQAARLNLASLAPGSILNLIVEAQYVENERRNLVCGLAFPDLDATSTSRHRAASGVPATAAPVSR